MKAFLILIFAISSYSAYALHPIEETHVEGIHQTHILEAQPDNNIAADSGELLKQLAGANTNKNGSLTSIAQYRGMYGDRININIDAMNMTSGGPNAMDAPLHYAPASLISSLSIHRGIAPVSAAQQAIGGAIVIDTKQGEFSNNKNWQVNGEVNAAYSSVNNANNINVISAVANDKHKIFISALTQSADDYQFPDGKVKPSGYERERLESGYAFENLQHAFSLQFTDNKTDDAGTPALPMDIDTIYSQFIRSTYRFNIEAMEINLKLGITDIEHSMNNYKLREAMNPLKLRENFATANAEDLKLSLKFDTQNGFISTGIDYHNSEHNSDISDPSNNMFFIENFNAVENSISGLFIETQQQLTHTILLDAGLRNNYVQSNAGIIDSSMAMMPAVKKLRDDFNNAQRMQSDNNIDAVLKLSFNTSHHWNFHTAIAQKTRSASYQERYLWLPLQSTGGLADGFNYIGNIELKPEIARELELGFDWNTASTFISPRIYGRKIDNYIQGIPTENTQAIMVSNAMGNANPPLEFSNVEAVIMGFDMPWHHNFNEHWALHGSFNMVRGERRDIDDNLYRIAPDNMRLAADYTINQYSFSLEAVAYNKQQRVAKSNNEKESSAYELLNAYFHYAINDDIKLISGIENLLDKNYQAHLGGTNRAKGNDVAIGARLPGLGRNLFAKVNWQF